MRNLFLYFGAAFFITSMYGQVGIGTTSPSSASMLEISSTSDEGVTYKGLMPPRVPNIAARNAIVPNISDVGLLVFVMNKGNGEAGLQIWNGEGWIEIISITIPSPEIWINEFHYDNAGTDIGEFIEIAGPAGLNLNNFSLELYNGTTGTNYNTVQLSGIIPNDMNGFGILSFDISGIQNGPKDGIAVVKNGVVIQFLSYEGTFTATGSNANGITSTDIGEYEPESNPVGYSLQLTGTGNSYNDFLWNAPSVDTPGALNTGQIFN
ncbi:hypothetical protein [Aequorivita marisscotiae]|uniref:Uncharacterized protein n=1 Tax=Aequorivita marisscotiae TaxID=3040348 RepID=A0ABY8KSH3_9FLAO|nr:hypothetical protein [Aequorivita sp. Ant34-E75]WGF91982.1 hypothetical protein QCQ61_12295 [Aequorivita sp. Ant34-E75]